MRVSIWNQFSSNHSASFTVVGAFESAEKAQAAAEEIRLLLAGVADHYSDPLNLEVFNRLHRNNEPMPLLPIEIEFAAKYRISPEEWTWNESGIDWITSSEYVEYAIEVYKHLIYIRNPCDTWLGAEPMNVLLERMGGKAAAWVEGILTLEINLSFSAPDEASADVLEVELTNALGKDRDEGDEAPRGFPGIPLGKLSRDGLRIHLYEAMVDTWEWEGLELMESTLTARGCTDIEYSFAQSEVT